MLAGIVFCVLVPPSLREVRKNELEDAHPYVGSDVTIELKSTLPKT